VEPAASVAGVILAGGRGRRMGGADKGWVSWQGRVLVEQVLERLLPQVAQMLISANRNLDRYRALGFPVIEDERLRYGSYAGPLAGMLAALSRCTQPRAVFVPCDAPALPADLVQRLVDGAGPTGAALACCGGRRQPVFCLLPVSLAPRLAAALDAGERRPTVFLETVGATQVVFDDPAAFANINAAAIVSPGEGDAMAPRSRDD
jgi:molybdopterin-guanine dinucleotide biosynthesis protein A